MQFSITFLLHFQETYHSKLTGQKDTILYWSWKSDIPLECTSHYVQIRCTLRLEGSPEATSWSEWSALAKIQGKAVPLV